MLSAYMTSITATVARFDVFIFCRLHGNSISSALATRDAPDR